MLVDTAVTEVAAATVGASRAAALALKGVEVELKVTEAQPVRAKAGVSEVYAGMEAAPWARRLLESRAGTREAAARAVVPEVGACWAAGTTELMGRTVAVVRWVAATVASYTQCGT